MHARRERPRALDEDARWDGLSAEAEWVTAAEFKTHCLRLVEAVRQGRREVVVTRYGTPVARLVPVAEAAAPLLGHLAGTLVSCGDLVSPVGGAEAGDG